jgi:glutamate/aspartate transport system substrate-binding protein
MLRRTAAALLACSLLAAPAGAAELTGTLKKVKESGTITLGVRESSVPFSYNDDSQKPVGYAVDICMKVVDAVKKATGRSDLKVEFIPANATNRIPLVTNGTMDLECASTSNLTERKRVVAFSLTHFVSNIKALVRKDSPYKSLKDLDGKSIAVINGMTAIPMLQKYAVDNKIDFKRVPGKDVAEAFLLFQQGRADAFVFDDILLASMVANASDPQSYRMLEDTLRSEPNALMFRKDDEPFKTLVDGTIKGLIASGETEKMYTRWFQQPIPPKGVNLNFPMSKELKAAFEKPNDDGV